MIAIYDFDGTLTPYALPNYEIMGKCGYNGATIMTVVKRIMSEQGVDLYTAYCKAAKEVLKENGFVFNKATLCLGVDKTEFNKGVLEYFDKLCYLKSGIRHYVVTSGFEDFVCETKVAKYLDGVLGTSFHTVNGVYGEIKRLMSNERKVSAIEEICEKYEASLSDVVYFGDGLTDVDAFRYVHENGGKSVLVCEGSKENAVYKELEGLGILDACFELDYSGCSELEQYVFSLAKGNCDSYGK